MLHARVHFDGFANRWDEHVPLTSSRMEPVRTHTVQPAEEIRYVVILHRYAHKLNTGQTCVYGGVGIGTVRLHNRLLTPCAVMQCMADVRHALRAVLLVPVVVAWPAAPDRVECCAICAWWPAVRHSQGRRSVARATVHGPLRELGWARLPQVQEVDLLRLPPTDG